MDDKNVPDETEITFTESGYDVTGYDVTINGQATTDAETGTVKATIAENETAIAKFTNEYNSNKARHRNQQGLTLQTTKNLKVHPFRSPEQTLMEKKLPLSSGHPVMMERTKMEQSRHIQ